MSYFCNPMNVEYKYQFFKGATIEKSDQLFDVFREAADPTLILFKDVYFLFPSKTAGFFTSEDLHDWKYYPLGEDAPINDYAPDVCVIGDYIYLSASSDEKNCSFYRSKDPREYPFEEIPGTFPFFDPHTFQDDDGRIYFYWGCSNMVPIRGVELDPETMTPLGEPIALIDGHDDIHGFERFGEDHKPPFVVENLEAQVDAAIEAMKQKAAEEGMPMPPEEFMRKQIEGYFKCRPYVEGAWMTKYNGKYYLQYGTPGTEYNVYANAVYVSDKPLGPYTLQKNNPYSYRPGGFMPGAGHGSTLKDKAGDYWHVATMRISNNNNMERRIGMWKAGFDQDGQLFCDQRFGDWPIRMDAKPFENPDYMLLSYGKKVSVSSGEGKEHLTDENAKTYWQADSAEAGEWAEIDLGHAARVCAVQINFADGKITMELPEGANSEVRAYDERWIDTRKKVTRWCLFGSLDGEEYHVIMDKSDAQTDLSHDFIELEEPEDLRFIKLRLVEVPFGCPFTLSGIRIFGQGSGEPPVGATNVTCHRTSDLDMDVSWEAPDATGACVMWGYAADKIYHAKTVMGVQSTTIGALIKDQDVYVRVDVFNENGIKEGNIIGGGNYHG